MKRMLLVLVLLALPAIAHAQTITRQLVFDTTDLPGMVATYTAAYAIDGGAVSVFVPACVVNVTVPPPTTCSFVLPKADFDKLGVAGTHNVVLTLTSQSGGRFTGSTNYIPGAVVNPTSPTTIRIELVIKVP